MVKCMLNVFFKCETYLIEVKFLDNPIWYHICLPSKHIAMIQTAAPNAVKTQMSFAGNGLSAD